MAAKKRQYHIFQYTLSDLEEVEGKLTVKLSANNLVNSSETLMYYILNKKIMGKSYDYKAETTTNDDGEIIKVKKNRLPLITIETGRNRSDKDNQKLGKLLNEGFYLENKNIHFVFLDNVLSGSQNKECRQIFVQEKYYAALKKHLSLGTEPTKEDFRGTLKFYYKFQGLRVLFINDVHSVFSPLKSCFMSKSSI